MRMTPDELRRARREWRKRRKEQTQGREPYRSVIYAVPDPFAVIDDPDWN